MDKLDLLGVKHDVEMEIKAKYELAEKIFNYWDNLCKNNLSNYADLKDNCTVMICMELGLEKYELTEEVQEIWSIIEKEYYGKNYVKIIDINGEIYSEYFEDYCRNEWFAVIDTQKLGENIGRTIIGDLDKNKIIGADGNYTSKFFGEILTKIEKEVTNELRNEICKYLFEYLDNNLE